MTGHPFVYVFLREDGARKVGFSANPKKREKHLRLGVGRLVLERAWQLENAREVEGITHRLLKQHRHSRASGVETYNLGLDEICAAVEAAIAETKRPGAIKKYQAPEPLPPLPLPPFEQWMADLQAWQLLRLQRYDEIAARLGRRMTRAEQREWLAAGGMDDHPAPPMPERKMA